MNELTDLMERSTADLQPDVEALVNGGIARGRRLRTRRRVTAGTGVVGTVAAVGLAVTLAPGTSAGPAAPAPAPLAASSTTAANVPFAPLPTRAALAHGEVVTLPAGSSHLIEAWGSRGQGFVAAAWTFTPASGGGAGRVSVLVEQAAMPIDGTGMTFRLHKGRMPTVPGADVSPLAGGGFRVTPEHYSPSEACHADGGTCDELPDGTWITTSTFDEPASGGGYSGIISTHATLWTTDGLEITATAYNAAGEKNVQPTRSAPVLSEAQLSELVRSAHLG